MLIQTAGQVGSGKIELLDSMQDSIGITLLRRVYNVIPFLLIKLILKIKILYEILVRFKLTVFQCCTVNRGDGFCV